MNLDLTAFLIACALALCLVTPPLLWIRHEIRKSRRLLHWHRQRHVEVYDSHIQFWTQRQNHYRECEDAKMVRECEKHIQELQRRRGKWNE